MGSLEDAAGDRLECLLKKFPPLYKDRLISSILDKMLDRPSLRSSQKQREIIPLLKVCIKTRQVLCGCRSNSYVENILPDYCVNLTVTQ